MFPSIQQCVDDPQSMNLGWQVRRGKHRASVHLAGCISQDLLLSWPMYVVASCRLLRLKAAACLAV